MRFLLALKPILRDFLSTIVFVSCVWITDNIVLSTAIGVTTGIVQTVWMLVRRHPIGLLQWISLGLVLTLGGTTILTHNGLFFKMKSSIVALILALVLSNRRWLAPYLPQEVSLALDEGTIAAAAREWAILLVAIAIANVAVAFTCSNRVWAFFILAAPTVSYILLLGVQYRRYADRFRQALARADAKP